MTRRPTGEEQGSLTVELVMLTPVLLMVVLVVVALGRVAEARQQVVEAARAGAEAAAVEPDPAGARAASEVDAAVGTSGHVRTCPVRQVRHRRQSLLPGRLRDGHGGVPGPTGRRRRSRAARIDHRTGVVDGTNRPLPIGAWRVSGVSGVLDRDQDGSLSAFVVLLLVALMALLGLVVDGGSALSARQSAVDEAEQAARAGAGALSVEALRAGALQLDPSAAVAAAESFARAAGHPGTASVSGGVVTVQIRYRVPTEVLGIIGIDSLPVSAQASAVDVQGVTVGSP